MFGGSKARPPRMDTLVGPNTSVTGEIRFEGGLHIDGRVEGNVFSQHDGSRVSLSEHGCIKGEVRVPTIFVDGTIEGDVYASVRIELGVHARINGNVYYSLLEMTSGASVNGKLVHKPSGQPLLELKRDKSASRTESRSDQEAVAQGK
ncbi:MAG: polymer-forming cytoskeletal protein [Gammaproteobacteria bacterium]